MSQTLEACPQCGKASAIRQKLILIDEAWVYTPGKDPREAYHSYLRVDDVKIEHLRERPLEQFIDGLHCDRCDKGFVSETELRETRRRY